MNGAALGAASITLAWLVAVTYGAAVLERLVTPPEGARRSVLSLVQPLSRAATLIRTRSPRPVRPDWGLFGSAPFIALATTLLATWFVPLGIPVRNGATSPVGSFWFLVFLAPMVVALANAGWGANGKYGLFGSMRAAAHIIAYEVVLGFAILGPAMAAESLSIMTIVEAQRPTWFVVWQPLGLVLYVVALMMATYRRPFDIPMAGSELSGGVLAEYGGARLLLLRFSLHAILAVGATVGAHLYLGGPHVPSFLAGLLPPFVWLLLKAYALVAFIHWIGLRVPRTDHGRMLAFSWKVVLPLSFVNLTIVGILILVRGG